MSSAVRALLAIRLLATAGASRVALERGLENGGGLRQGVQASETVVGPQDPAVVKEALRSAWALADRGEWPAADEVPLESGERCHLSPLPEVNGARGLGRVREQWRKQFPGDFMDASSPADALVAKFTKLEQVTQGSKSGSSIYISDGAQLLLKSEGDSERKVFTKTRTPKTGGKAGREVTFVEEYVERVTGVDVEEADRECQRSTLMRFLLVFSVRCASSSWLSSAKPVVWMLFANVSPFPKVPRAMHSFDVKASRGMDDCHANSWTATNGRQGFLGDFLSLYKEPIEAAQCSGARADFRNSTRKACFMRSLHKDLRLLSRYSLIDYSFYVTVHQYDEDIDAEGLQAYNNLIPLTIAGKEKVLTIGTIDLLKDWDASAGIRFQNWAGLTKRGGFTQTVFGQRKFDSYGYYLFCLAVDLLDPTCETSRSLQLLSKCPKGDDATIYFPEAGQASRKGERLMRHYLEEADYCDLVNSCNALVRVPDVTRELGVCEEHACRILGFKRCPVGVSGEGHSGGIWRWLGLVDE